MLLQVFNANILNYMQKDIKYVTVKYLYANRYKNKFLDNCFPLFYRSENFVQNVTYFRSINRT